MALVKGKTRKKLAKQLRKLVKKHGAEVALALVTGIVTSLSADNAARPRKVKPVVRPRPKAPAPVIRRRAAL